jgi:S-adenosylmethionine hydrolase
MIVRSMAARPITLTTDFGTRDAYVAAMKGTILGIYPEARLIDVTHEIAPQDVMEAAFVLREAVPYFPADAVHLVVVDPGVGTERRPVALRHGPHWFVGPDNGVFPLVLDGKAPDRAVELDRKTVWRTTSPSTTFHGRDIFAPAAAHLARGLALSEIGSPIDALDPLRWAQPITDEEGLQGWVVHIDHFGNCITNITREMLLQQAREVGPPHDTLSPPPFKCFAGNSTFDVLHETYGHVDEGDPLLLIGSSGFLEVAVNSGNAAELLDIRKGDTVNIIFRDGSA